MMEEACVTVGVDSVGASLPCVCNFPVEHHVVCSSEDDGVLVLPHHDFFQIHVDIIVGYIFS